MKQDLFGLLLLGIIVAVSLTGCSISPHKPAKNAPSTPSTPCQLTLTTDPVAVLRYSSSHLSLEKHIHIAGCVEHGRYTVLWNLLNGGGSLQLSGGTTTFSPPDVTSDPTGRIDECQVALSATCPHGKKVNGTLTIRIIHPDRQQSHRSSYGGSAFKKMPATSHEMNTRVQAYHDVQVVSAILIQSGVAESDANLTSETSQRGATQWKCI